MPATSAWLRPFICSSFIWGILLTSCVSAPRVIAIPSVSEPVGPSVARSTDYPEALAAIMSVMSRHLKMPAVEGSVTFYPTQVSYEAGVIAEAEKDLAQLRKQPGPRAKEVSEQEIVFAARRSAVSSVAVGMYRRVLVNQKQLRTYSWWERVQVLAHELTHTVEKEWVEGRIATWDRWLSEGFAEWAGYNVLDRLGAQTLAKSRQGRVDAVAKARHRQNFPTLTQLVMGEEWITWLRIVGHPATYGQAFLAVDLLVEQKGLPTVVEYFRLFEKSNDRERNFVAAFGEPVVKFEEKFSEHLKALLGR